jgi:hypothetical protein
VWSHFVCQSEVSSFVSELALFYQKARTSGKPISATYLLSGTPASDVEETPDSETVHSSMNLIVLANEDSIEGTWLCRELTLVVTYPF